jgi:hypothetical protein
VAQGGINQAKKVAELAEDLAWLCRLRKGVVQRAVPVWDNRANKVVVEQVGRERASLDNMVRAVRRQRDRVKVLPRHGDAPPWMYIIACFERSLDTLSAAPKRKTISSCVRAHLGLSIALLLTKLT